MADQPAEKPRQSYPDYRVTLANERTYLAYERTAVGLAGTAVAVLHLLDDTFWERALGVALLIAACIAGIGGYVRFRAVQRAVEREDPLPSNPTATLLAAAFAVCLVLAGLSVLR